jgi:hypothetical protein
MHTFAKKPKATQQTTPSKSMKTSRPFSGQSRDVQSILHLQRKIGNQAVLRRLQTATENIEASSKNSTSTEFSHDFSSKSACPSTRNSIKPKLKVNALGDQYEQEADRIASQVLRQKRPENEEEKTFQSKACSHQSPNPSSKPKKLIAALQGGGQPLPQSEQAFFEPRFGADFSRIRVHADRQAAETARAVNARAFTLGQDIVFGAGEYKPTASGGRKLLAHELAHVVQQGSKSNSMPNSYTMIQRYDVTQMSITPQYARGLSDEELREQIRILTEQTLEFEFLGTSTLDSDEEVAQSNLSVLQAEQRRRNRAVTEMSITPQYAEALSDEELREQIHILREQTLELELLGTSTLDGEEEVAQSNLSILLWEQFPTQFNTHFANILTELGANEEGFTTAQLQGMFTETQRDLLQQYLTPAHPIPEGLFNGSERGGASPQQRILISSHMLAHGNYQHRDNAEGLEPQTGRVHAGSCGNWARLVLDYAGASPDHGASLPNRGPDYGYLRNEDDNIEGRLDRSALHGGSTPGDAPSNYNSYTPDDLSEEQALQWERRNRRREAMAGARIPRARLDGLQPGDWIYIFNDQGRRTLSSYGQHSLIFIRWIRRPSESGGYYFGRAMTQDQLSPSQGGQTHEINLGDHYRQTRPRIFPVTNVMRVAENTGPAR